jgi:putative aminopeptidase FrvX
MHTSVETLAVSDVKATAKLLAAFIEEFTDLDAFDFAKEVLK